MFKIITSIMFLIYSTCAVGQEEEKYIDNFYYTKVLNKKPTYNLSTNPKKFYTPYYVEYDFGSDTCTIHYNKNKNIFDPKLVKFAMYHEASHCVLYQEAVIYKSHPKIFNLILADSLNNQQDRKIGYMYFHELYADSLATALFLNESDDKSAIEALLQMRIASPFGAHQTQELVQQIIAMEWKNKNSQQIKEQVLDLTEKYFLKTWIDRYFKPERESDTLEIMASSLIKSFWGAYHYKTNPEEDSFYEDRFSGFSQHMNNPNFKLLEIMYNHKDDAQEEVYLKGVCEQGNWCN